MKKADIKKEVKKFKKTFFRSMRNDQANPVIPQIIFDETVILVNHLIDLGLDSASSVRTELNNLVSAV